LMSFSNPGYSQALQDAVDYAWSKGVVVVAATGNDGVSTPTYPAGDAKVVGVSATDPNDNLASFSNSGADTFIAAPGTGIVADAVGGGIATISGTSASAAEVAGAAALVRANDPSASNAVIVGRLAESADAAGTNDQTGNGRLNLARALGDTSRNGVVPVGAPSGGPFVGPYITAANNGTFAYTKTGAGTGTVTFSTTGTNPDAPTGLCTVTTNTATCTGSGGFGYKKGDSYTITASPVVGFSFAGWSSVT